jgi:uncharacterized protein YjbJ (UPF0337 family)
MHWVEIEQSWLHYRGKLRQNWAKLTEDDILRINGQVDELAACLQNRYGFAKNEANNEIGAWVRSQHRPV